MSDSANNRRVLLFCLEDFNFLNEIQVITSNYRQKGVTLNSYILVVNTLNYNNGLSKFQEFKNISLHRKINR